MDAACRPAALFDFDGTITRRDSLVPILLSLLRRYPGALAELPRLAALLGPFAAGWISLERMKAQTLRIFRWVPAAELQPVLERLEQAVLRPMYFPGAIERIAWHRTQGHRLVLISASLELYLRPAARRLGFDALLATRAALEGGPRVLGANCWGREKVQRLLKQPWFAQVDWAASWAYSDHLSDLPMLMLCGHPVATTPGRALRRHARRLGWPVFDWR